MFLNFRADDGDRSPWGDFWFNPVPYRGGLATADNAMTYMAVYACVRILAEGVASLPFTLSRVSKDGSRTKVTDHWLYRLFAVRPNEYQNPFEFMEMLEGHCALRGNAYCQIFADRRGQVTDLIPLNPAATTVEQLSTGDWRFRVVKVDGSQMYLARNEVFHLKGLSSDGIQGISPVDCARLSISLGMAADNYGNRFFQNDARPGGWIESPTFFKDRDDKARFREAWQSAQSGGNSSKTAVLEGGMKYHETELDNDAAQFLQTRKFQKSEIAGWFRIPPHMIGDLEKATFSNIEQQSLDFVINTLRPWLTRWEAAIRNTFLDPEDPDNASLEIEFPTTALLRGDATARAAYYGSGILNGWMTRNEVRAMEKMNPLDGLDEPLVPMNTSEEGDPPAATPGHAPNTNPGTPKQPTPGKPSQSRANAIAEAAARRVARKECAHVLKTYLKLTDGGPSFESALVEFYTDHTDFISAALALDEPAAKQAAADGLNAVMANFREFGNDQAAFAAWLEAWEGRRAFLLAGIGDDDHAR